MSARYQVRIDAALCGRGCGRPADAGHKTCGQCRAYSRAYGRALREGAEQPALAARPHTTGRRRAEDAAAKKRLALVGTFEVGPGDRRDDCSNYEACLDAWPCGASVKGRCPKACVRFVAADPTLEFLHLAASHPRPSALAAAQDDSLGNIVGASVATARARRSRQARAA